MPARDIGAAEHPNPTDVQLVACVRLIGNALDKPLTQCSYNWNPPIIDTLYQGLYRLDVYEARTGRHIGSSQLTGSEDEHCPELRDVPQDGSTRRDIATEPDTSTLRDALAPLVH